MGTIAPEFELLLWSARDEIDPSTIDPARTLIRGDLDWERVLHWGEWHGTLPRLYSHLRALDGGDVPAPVLDRLRDRFYAVARRNLYLTAELFALLDAFDERGIPAIPLKGAMLSNSIYPNPAHREFLDLDLLVRPHNVRAAAAVLQSRRFAPWFPLDGAQAVAYDRTHYARTYERAEGQVVVDLHWGFAPPELAPGIDARALWPTARPTTLDGRLVHAFPPEVQLLLLCLHGAKHHPIPWPKLKWVSDVAGLLRANPELDWERVRESARIFGVRRMLFLGLALAHDLLGASLPETVRREVAGDAVVQGLAACVQRAMLDGADPPGFSRRLALEVRLHERIRDKIRLVLRRVASPTRRDWELVRLPAALAWLYLPLRLARLAGAYALRPWRFTRLLR